MRVLGDGFDQLESKQATSANLTETTSLKLDVEKLLADQTNYVVITRGSGPGVLYYTAYMDYTLPVKDIPALDQGIFATLGAVVALFAAVFTALST